MKALHVLAVCLAMVVVSFVAGLVVACGPTAGERARCYARADAAAQERVDRECTGSFDTCPVADSIMADLKAAQEACP